MEALDKVLTVARRLQYEALDEGALVKLLAKTAAELSYYEVEDGKGVKIDDLSPDDADIVLLAEMLSQGVENDTPMGRLINRLAWAIGKMVEGA